jgi:AraC-like DNA-binding protein
MGIDAGLLPPDGRLDIRTADLGVARDLITKTFAEHKMSLARGGVLDLRLHLTPPGRFTLTRLGYGADLTISAPPMKHCYQINLPITGANTVQQNGVTGIAEAGRRGIAMVPDSPLAMRWAPDTVQFAMKFPKDLMEAHAAKLTGRPVDDYIRFPLAFDLTSAPGRALLSTAAFLHGELSRPEGLATMPAVRRELESALVTQLLMTIPNQMTERLDRRPHGRRSRIIGVIDYIDEHPADDLSTAELAAMAGVCARALQAGFREVVGMSPRAYVRSVRLDRVHLELSRGGYGSATAVAARWGFFNPGRFAQQYRDRFGVRPSETCRSSGNSERPDRAGEATATAVRTLPGPG